MPLWGLGAFDREEWGVSTGDLSPLGPQAHITLLWSITHNHTHSLSLTSLSRSYSISLTATPTLPF